MQPLIIESTADTPSVCLDKTANKFEIRGASLPPNIFEFYQPILNWLNKYSKDPNKETLLKLKFDYLNSSSTKMIHNIISVLESMNKNGINVGVSWYYDFGDFEMKEMGEDFASSCEIPFRLITSRQNGK